MGRGPKPVKSKVGAKRPVSRKSPEADTARVRDLEKRLAEALKREAEAQEQQTATAEILAIISRSPADAQPVFDAIAVNALRLCDAEGVVVARYDGALLHVAAHHNVDREGIDRLKRSYPRAADRDLPVGRAVLDRAVVHVTDLQEAVEFSGSVARQGGMRSQIAIPLLHQGRAIGAIGISRLRLRPFTDQQIALLQTFADQAVIAIENVRLFNETKEALERQTATSEILRVISSSPTDVQPVFEAIAKSALHLCDSSNSVVGHYDGDLLHLAAHAQQTAEAAEALRRTFPIRPSRATASGRAVLEGTVIHIPDVQADPEYAQPLAEVIRARATLAVPMLRNGQPIGTIAVGWLESRPFSDKHAALLQTFADQAVIAIENVRLFNETKEALERQTATAEILRVISSSPTDIQPVLDTVAESASRLCEAYDTSVFRLEGDRLRRVAHHGPIPAGVIGEFTVPLVRGSFAGRSVLDGRIVHLADGQTEAKEFPEGSQFARRLGFRAILLVPLLRDGVAIGVITLRRTEARLFTQRQVALLQTFADQAVIAIENVRLFKDLQTSNRDLTTALDKQTATSEILQVISQSQTDVQPVFDAIVNSAVRLLAGYAGTMTRVVGDQVALVTFTSTDDTGDTTLRETFPRPLDAPGTSLQAIRDRAPVNIANTQTDPRVGEVGHAIARARGYQSMVAVPMLHHDEALGAIAVTRRESGGFTDDEIALLKTFADQAVIAIENVRLFKELEARTQELTRSVGELQALSEVGQAISSSLDLQAVLSTIAARATQLSGTDAGVIYEYDETREVFVPRATEHLEAAIVETMLATPVRKGEGATGRLAEVQEPVQVPDILAAPAESPVRGALVRAGYRALLAVPLIREGHLLGGLTVIRKATGAFAPEVIDLLRTFAIQSALAIQNARLFREIEDKSRQLEVASQHKSEFLANMSHELRTPLNAIIGFSEVLSERMFGDLNEKQEEYSKDIHASGQHLLSLINDILDLSKIEAGRMELELSDFHLPTALDSALTLVRERAGRRSIALHTNIDTRLGQIQADERKVRQVALNLLSNAIKFTPEGGRIEVAATPKDGLVEVSVSDTGVGIAPEDQEAVFEEFRQVGTADKKVEGTGLGLTLCRKFVELHGGRIWVKSELGVGSTFTFTIPVRST